MTNFKSILVLTISLVSTLCSCDDKENEQAPEDGFTKIYSSDDFSGTYEALDLKQTLDGGFLILAQANQSSFKQIHLLKTDEAGNMEWRYTDSSVFVNPLKRLIQINNEFFLMAMQSTTLKTHLLRVNMAARIVEDERQIGDLSYPLAIDPISGGYLLLSFDRVSRKTSLTKLSNGMNLQWSEEYQNLENPQQFEAHLTGESPLPFFTGELDVSTYYFNGFYNQKMTLVFVNANNGSIRKTIEGHRYEACVSSISSLANQNFFFSYYNRNGENTILNPFAVDLTSNVVINILNNDEVPQNLVYSYPLRAQFIIDDHSQRGKSFFIIGANTLAGQSELRVHNKSNGGLINKTLFGGRFPILYKRTIFADDQLIMLFDTFAGGKLSRFGIRKFSKDETEEVIN